jgi:hypothetical protein
MKINTTLKSMAVALSVALLAPLAATPVYASQEPTLFGTSDPTYDGVYRHSLALIALSATKTKLPASARTWLAMQQCADGGFMAFRENTSAPCLQGLEDSNSTALAALALSRFNTPAAKKAGTWLTRHLNADGGIGYYPMGEKSDGYDPTATDANSTGLTWLALKALKTNAVAKIGKGPLNALRSIQLACSGSSSDGAFDYSKQENFTANALSTAQAVFALSGVSIFAKSPAGGKNSFPKFACKDGKPVERSAQNMAAAGAGYLGRTLKAGNGLLASPWGPGSDYNTTAWAVIALASSGQGAAQAKNSAQILAANVEKFAYTTEGNVVRPAAAATLILAAQSVGADPKKFGGKNLVALLLSTLSKPS